MPAKILICDNEAPLRALVRAALDARYEVVEARDGEESLDAARTERPDAVVLDMMMPGLTGLEVVRTMRADPELAETPVVMVTARAQAADREAALAAGADRFVTKPFSPVQLASLVDELVDGAP